MYKRKTYNWTTTNSETRNKEKEIRNKQITQFYGQTVASYREIKKSEKIPNRFLKSILQNQKTNFPLSEIRHLKTKIRNPWFLILFPISDFQFPISDFWFAISDFRILISDFWFLISDFWFLISEFWFLIADFWFLFSNFWFLISDFWFRISDFGFRISNGFRISYFKRISDFSFQMTDLRYEKFVFWFCKIDFKNLLGIFSDFWFPDKKPRFGRKIA